MDIYVDASGWNGGDCALCFATSLKKDKRKVTIVHHEMSSTEAEYHALISALNFADKHSRIFTDCLPIFNQIIGKTNVTKENEKKLHSVAVHLMEVKKIKLFWIPREENIAGQILESRRQKLNIYKRECVNHRKRKR